MTRRPSTGLFCPGLLCLLAVMVGGSARDARADGGALAAAGGERRVVGAFVAPALPHPILEPEQRYFRPSSAGPDTEWIAIVPEPLRGRIRLDVPMRIRGRAVVVDLGGAPGSKASYRGTKLLVTEIEGVE